MNTRTDAADQFGDKVVKGGTVTADFGSEFEAFAAGEDGHAVIADRAVDQDDVAGLGVAAANVAVVFDDADPGGIDKEFISFAARHDLGVAGDDLHPGLIGGAPHRDKDPP